MLDGITQAILIAAVAFAALCLALLVAFRFLCRNCALAGMKATLTSVIELSQEAFAMGRGRKLEALSRLQ